MKIPELLCRRIERIGEVTGAYNGLQGGLRCALLSDKKIFDDAKFLDWKEFERKSAAIRSGCHEEVNFEQMASENDMNLRKVADIVLNIDRRKVVTGMRSFGKAFSRKTNNPYLPAAESKKRRRGASKKNPEEEWAVVDFPDIVHRRTRRLSVSEQVRNMRDRQEFG